MTKRSTHAPHEALAAFPLLRDLETEALARVFANLHEIALDPGDFLCRQGDRGDSLFLVANGLVEVWLESSGGRHLVRRLRQGDVVGEMALLTGKPRSADVIANVPSTVLELDAATFASITAEHPKVLHNIARVLIEREHASADLRFGSGRGESVALVVGDSVLRDVAAITAAATSASVEPPMVVDLTGDRQAPLGKTAINDVPGLLAQLDRLLQVHDRVLVVVGNSLPTLGPLLQQMDRIVTLLTPDESARFDATPTSGLATERILASSDPSFATPGIVRRVALPIGQADMRWIGRHLTRTRIGLALGAGGAKGFAHVGAFRVLEQAGYVFDYVAGASIGSILGSGIAMGMSARELASVARWLMSSEVCGPYFRLIEGDPDEPGQQRFYDALTRFADGRHFEDLPVPLAVMTADLNAKQPYVFQSGALADALHAALAIPGLAPPFERPGQRLVDGVTISPVPTHVLQQMGADITVSINLMSRDELARWPEEESIPPLEKRRSKTLDPMIETLIMLQLDTSIRNAAAADVVISPMFAPSSWRDIHLADRFEAAGERAARLQLPALAELARPSGPPAAGGSVPAPGALPIR
jgi:NTE family protein